MKKIVLSLILPFSLQLNYAQGPSIVKALASTVLIPNDKDQEIWKNNEWNGQFFYQGTGSPTKLCVTNGTNAGTQFLTDIGSGTVSAAISAQDFIYIITNRLASFSPFAYEAQIWKSNGTAGGTSLVYTMPQTSISNACIWTSDRDGKRNFSVSGNTLFFGGYDAVNGNELWVTDGTAAGTHIVKDIKAGTGNSSPYAFCKIGADVFFTCMQTGLERKLWKTDGTEAGTVQIPVAEPFFILDNAVGIVNDKMIFYAHNTVDGYEPYVSDGTAAGTFMLANINPAGNSWLSVQQNAHLRFNNKHCFFVANNGTANALWRTDGSSAGTIQLTTNAQAAFSGVSGGSYTETDAAGLWMIEYNTSGSGNNEKLYRTDGTVAGTYLAASALSYAQYLKSYNGALWMASRNTGSAANVEPWRSGGNAATTNKAFEIEPATSGSPTFTPISSSPYGFFVKNNKLYFFAATSVPSGHNLYQYTGNFTFNGNLAGGQWKDSANWNGLMPPGITDTVYVNAGTPNALNVNTGNAYAGTLILGNNATINITNATDSLIVNTAIASGTNNNFTGNGVLAFKNNNADSAVVVNNGFAAYQLAALTAANLQSGNITVANNLNLVNNSLFSLNNNSLTLTGTTSTITQTGNSYINTNGTGKLTIENIGSGGRTGAVIFPVGNAGNYNPVTFTNTGVIDNFSVRVQPQIFAAYTAESGTGSYTNNAVNATWFITEANAGGSNADITLQWNVSQELPGFDRAQSYLGHYTGGIWALGTQGIATGANPYSYNRTNIISFSPFGILNNNATLPLTFLSFSAQKCNKNVCLNWKTENELNVSYFTIERSTDGVIFIPVKNEPAKNTLSNEYNNTDDIAAVQNSTKLFYRLKQVDADGRFTYSNTAIVTLSKIQGISIYPNPVTDKIYISGYEKVKQVQLYTLKGEKIKETTALPGIDVSSLARGIYFVKILLKSGASTAFKFIKQ